jgi:hypothetical protein
LNTVSLTSEAEIELYDAALFYDTECPGLGADFIHDVMLAIELIEMHPEHGILLRGRVRRKLLRNFPYSLMYSIRESGIRILAVAHQKRRPFYWQHRK